MTTAPLLIMQDLIRNLLIDYAPTLFANAHPSYDSLTFYSHPRVRNSTISYDRVFYKKK